MSIFQFANFIFVYGTDAHKYTLSELLDTASDTNHLVSARDTNQLVSARNKNQLVLARDSDQFESPPDLTSCR